MKCKKCKTEMIKGKALIDVYGVGITDFIGQCRNERGQTMSATGEAALTDCLKCPECGWSLGKKTSTTRKEECNCPVCRKEEK
jgi:hypothetical protein